MARFESGWQIFPAIQQVDSTLTAEGVLRALKRCRKFGKGLPATVFEGEIRALTWNTNRINGARALFHEVGGFCGGRHSATPGAQCSRCLVL